MNCAVHTEVAASAFCRTCGRALCDECKREVQGVIYCETCIASRMADTMPAAAPGLAPPGPPSPALAALLGFIPGVGAVYNGQFMKGLLHVAVFVALVWIAGEAGPAFGVPMIPFFVFYMVFDAYTTARARELGQPLPDPFGIERMLGGASVPPPPAARATAQPTQSTVASAVEASASPAAPAPAAPAPAEGPPVGAFILIGLGVLFLLNTMNIFYLGRMREFWPLILIAIGLYLFFTRAGGRAR